VVGELSDRSGDIEGSIIDLLATALAIELKK